MRPLRVEIPVRGPVHVGPYPLHLDALIAYGVTARRLATGTARGHVRDLAADLPLARASRGADWVWQASAVVPADAGREDVRFFVRRIDDERLARDVAEAIVMPKRRRRALGRLAGGDAAPARCAVRVSGLDQAALKGWFVRHVFRPVSRLVAWCIGDAERIAEALGELRHVGKYARFGFGRVDHEEGIVVTEDEAAIERWKYRVLPWPEEGYVPVQATVTPPYWDVARQRQAWMPKTPPAFR